MVTASTEHYHYILQKMNHFLIFLGNKYINVQKKICSTLKNFLMRMKEFKLDGYINKIKENEFFAGVIEIYIAFKLFKLGIKKNIYKNSIIIFSFIEITIIIYNI